MRDDRTSVFLRGVTILPKTRRTLGTAAAAVLFAGAALVPAVAAAQ